VNGQNPDVIGKANVFAITVSSDLITDTPEPATLALFGSALACLGLLRRRA
jgi:hypothetical protein